ncbi:MAG TPA: hypothetical protein VFS92_01385 [Planctomycetota bacterium]|nr:hypothetical protein [Planctomycetota bacterium]
MTKSLLLAAALASIVASPARADDGEPAKKKDPVPVPAAGAKPAEPKKDEPKKDDAKREPAKAPAAKKEPAKEAKPAVDTPLRARAPRSKDEALRILASITLRSVTFDETPLPQVVSWLGAATGLNLTLGPALIKEGDPDAIRITMTLRQVTAKQVLDLIVDGRGLGVGFHSGIVLVTTAKEARGKPTLRLYPVSDITHPLRDFPAPDLVLRSQGDEREVEQESETKSAFPDADSVLNLVKDHTGEGTWDDGDTSASVMGDTIVVRQYAEVHREIAHLLAMLRAAR